MSVKDKTVAETELELRRRERELAPKIEMGVQLAEVREAIITGAKPRLVNPDVIAKAIALRLLECEDLDEVMNPEDRNADGVPLDTPFTLRSCMFLPSDIEDSVLPVYAVMDIVDPAGRAHIASCGGQGVIVQLVRLVEANALPRRVKLIEVGSEKAGRNRPLYLQDVKAG